MKTVKISENKLVDLIENIVEQRIKDEKSKWISEQKKSKESLLESKVRKLEKVINRLNTKK